MNESRLMKKKMKASASLSEKDKYLIVRENSKACSSSNSLNSITVQSFFDSNNSFRLFFENHSCYDLVPDSSKLVVFDTSLNVQKAFYALIYNGVRAGILWDNDHQDYVGMFTITDFIKILHSKYRESGRGDGTDFNSFQQLETQSISNWRSQYGVSDADFNEMESVRPEDSLKQAVQSLLRKRVHRLPVIDAMSGNPLHIITHKRILKFLYLNLYHLPTPSFMNRRIADIPIGTYAKICTVRYDQSIIHCLNIFLKKRVSALPVVDENGVLHDIYSKFDVINLATTRTYHQLDATISLALQTRQKKFEEVATCLKTDTLQSVVEKFHSCEVHRLVIVDKDRHVEGIVSLSDVLELFIRDQPSDA